MITIQKKPLLGVPLLVVLVCSVTAIAMICGEDRGAWSSDWSKELEPYRARASTVSERPIGGGEVYTIPFADRGDFEKIWPVLVNLKSKGAPLILRSGGIEVRPRWSGVSVVKMDKTDKEYSVAGEAADPGTHGIEYKPVDLVLITSEETGKEYSPGWPQGTHPGVKIYAPTQLPYAKGSSRDAGAEAQDHATIERSTTVIELFVGDGKVIDLNRIRLPAETPIVDNRVFENDQKQPTTKPGSP
jgi:hypothetical protein